MQVIRGCELDQLRAARSGSGVTGYIPDEAIGVSTYSFTDFHVTGTTHEEREGGTWTETSYGLREVSFAHLPPVERSWNPFFVFVPALTAGIIGPFFCELESPGASILSGPWPFELGNVIPFWLIGAWFWWNPDDELSAYAEALEVLRRSASGTWGARGGGGEAGDADCSGNCCPDGGNTCSCTAWGQCGMSSCRPQ